MVNGENAGNAKAVFVQAASSTSSMSSVEVPLSEHRFYKEMVHDYRVSLSPAALNAIEAEIRSNARSGSSKDETGGLLLGEIDDSLKSITIDFASEPPPDSKKSRERFVCGVEGTHKLCEYHEGRSGRSTKFVGVWHTHPVSSPEPSAVDISAMDQILHNQKKTPRHVVMLIVGHAAETPELRFHLYRRNEFKTVSSTIGGDANGA